MLTYYGYNKCGTCSKAMKFLVKRHHEMKEIDITVSPPSAKELAWLIKRSGRPYTDFLNRSGVMCRDLNMKEKVKILSKSHRRVINNLRVLVRKELAVSTVRND